MKAKSKTVSWIGLIGGATLIGAILVLIFGESYWITGIGGIIWGTISWFLGFRPFK